MSDPYEAWMLQQWDVHAAVQDRPVPCYVCGADVGVNDGWHRDGKAWCPDHQPVWAAGTDEPWFCPDCYSVHRLNEPCRKITL